MNDNSEDRKPNRFFGRDMYIEFAGVDLTRAAVSFDGEVREVAPKHDGETLIQPNIDSFTVSFTVGLGPRNIPIFVVEDGVNHLRLVSEEWLKLMFLFGYFSLDDAE